ncbi:Protein N-lysine methyltransferase METTL21A [Morella rubra]|uniref:Protein N-lysine methyltransferase METTL21A n=1 Tax=Morella rubra TaxID=262757 RepID=A0A6A1UMK5_9ROSI|nr:Protein N-lysine methyltransferase METTL21A [Morella rubra]KAB1201150.1 Protein N-lysine methyltransferase METTL21A [Morella rubra]
MWDSGVVLAKFLEHAVDSGLLLLQAKKVVELGSGCGLVGCVAALLGSQVFLTDLPDRLKLLKKNVEANLTHANVRGSATVTELVWGDDFDQELIELQPDYDLFGEYTCTPGLSSKPFATNNQFIENYFQISIVSVLGSDVIYSEEAVADLVDTLLQLCGPKTTVFLAGELRNVLLPAADAILEYFLEVAMKNFVVGRVDQTQWHPDYCSSRVVVYVLVKK